MKKGNSLTLMLLLLVITGFVSSCKKSDHVAFDLSTSTTPVLYPTKISYIKTTGGVAAAAVVVYTYTYNPMLDLLTINNRRNGSTADTIYNNAVVDANKHIQQLGTNNNAKAYQVQYDATGNISSVSQFYRSGTANVSDVRSYTYDANGQITQSVKNVAGSATPQYTNTYTTVDGNITSGSVYNFNFSNNVNNNAVTTLPPATTFTYYDSTLPNPFYGLAKNGMFAFMPEQLWVNSELILFSKNLIKEYITANNPTLMFTYQFDKYNRITGVTSTNETGPSVSTAYTITYAN